MFEHFFALTKSARHLIMCKYLMTRTAQKIFAFSQTSLRPHCYKLVKKVPKKNFVGFSDKRKIEFSRQKFF